MQNYNLKGDDQLILILHYKEHKKIGSANLSLLSLSLVRTLSCRANKETQPTLGRITLFQ